MRERGPSAVASEEVGQEWALEPPGVREFSHPGHLFEIETKSYCARSLLPRSGNVLGGLKDSRHAWYGSLQSGAACFSFVQEGAMLQID
jgi:hypothetical protein